MWLLSDVTCVIIDAWPRAADSNDYVFVHISYVHSLGSIDVSCYFLQELIYDWSHVGINLIDDLKKNH